MTLPDNFQTLHAEEERIRSRSLGKLESDSRLSDHMRVIQAAMNVIVQIAESHDHRNNDEKTIQYLGLRLFNASASSLKLGLSGYYLAAFAIIRDIVETVHLLDYLREFPEKISSWEVADRKARMNQFGPVTIRKALDERDGLKEAKRKQLYDQLSEYASHPTAQGFHLVAPDGLGKIGPFFSERHLQSFVEELVEHVVHGGVVFESFFSRLSAELTLTKIEFLELIVEWREKYLAKSAPDAT